MRIDAAIRRAFIVLAPQPEISAAVCGVAASGRLNGPTSLKAICSAAGLPQAQAYRVVDVLERGTGVGAFLQYSGASWSSVEGFQYQQLELMLEGAAMYRQDVHVPSDSVEVILTVPPKPSRLEDTLRARGYKAAFLERTSTTFEQLASSAQRRFLVMTPFIDESGVQNLLELFARVADGAVRQLILRCRNNELPTAVAKRRDDFLSLKVAVHNYWLPRGQEGRYETFHAKLLLVDESKAYVGSSNMTEASLAFSMELGFLVEGKAAEMVAWMSESVRSIAPRML